MAVRVLRSTLSRDAEEAIRKELLLVPVQPMTFKNGRKQPLGPPSPPLRFWATTPEIAYVPAMTAKRLQIGPYSPLPQVAEKHIHAFCPKQFIPNERAVFTSSLLSTEGRDQVAAMATADKALEASGTVVFGMPPGFGKTRCTVYQIARRKLQTLVVMPLTNLVEQWVGEVQANSKMEVVAWTAAAQNRKTQPDWSRVDVIVSLGGGVSKLPESVKQSIGLLVVDEAHKMCTPGNIDMFLQLSPWFMVICSATLERPDGLHRMMLRMSGLAGSVVPPDTIEAANTSRGIFLQNQTFFTLYRVRTPFVPETKTNVAGSLDWNSVKASLAFSPQRNGLLLDLARWFVARGRKPVFLVFYQEHVEQLLHDFAAAGLSVASMYKDQNSYEDADVLIGSGKIDTGFDQKTACVNWDNRRIDTLVVTHSMAHIGPVVQSFGRAFRTSSPEIYYLVDQLTVIEKHWRLAREYAEEKVLDAVTKTMRPNGEVKTFDIGLLKSPSPSGHA